MLQACRCLIQIFTQLLKASAKMTVSAFNERFRLIFAALASLLENFDFIFINPSLNTSNDAFDEFLS